MQAILENILVMILTIVVPLAALYLVLVFIGWRLKNKSGNREQEGLTDLWIASQTSANPKKTDSAIPEKEPSDGKSP